MVSSCQPLLGPKINYNNNLFYLFLCLLLCLIDPGLEGLLFISEYSGILKEFSKSVSFKDKKINRYLIPEKVNFL